MAHVTPSDSGAAKSDRGRRKRTSIHLDMTPMVDLAFLLLTFFILTTSLLDLHVVEVSMPDKPDNPIHQPPIQREKVLTLLLGEKDKIYWYQGGVNPRVDVSTYSSEGIRKILLEKKRKIKGLYVFIKPMKNSRYKNTVDILDEMMIAEIERYVIMKVSPEDKDLIAEANFRALNNTP